ncbi:MAG TPA: DUF885 domain-containing protein [Thermoanaerobaculia bacterium]|nr:DUF885 domain-containing protein [Thermoanaerobaculia bacterium]
MHRSFRPSLRGLAAAALLLAALPAAAAPAPTPAWVERSDENAQVLLEVLARFGPEGAGQLGIPGLDEQILDLSPGFVERATAAASQAGDELRRRLATEKDPAVRQDLQILIGATEDNIRGNRMEEKYFLPYFNVTQIVFGGLQSLLDDQIEAGRRPAALVRLRKYTGMEPGTTPLTRLAEDFTRARLADPKLLGPFKDQIERDLATNQTVITGIGELFAKYGIQGYEEPYAKLKEQLAAYDAFVKKEILPRARTDFRLPPEVYAENLKQVGIDMPIDDLVSRAEVAFKEIQNEMAALAPLVAKEKGIASTDYREVLRELKKKQIVGDAILPLYEERIRGLEEIIRKEKIVTLPDRAMKFRVASEAESVGSPAPHMQPPRLIGNTGEMGEFVLPLRIPGQQGQKNLALDDFTYDAFSWALTAHEGRPGHELQFAALVEKGVSKARAIFAFNSVNVEGWALYSEAEVKPYLPLDGQLAALQSRLARAARAILDPSLQKGTVTREEAMRILQEEVGLSEGMALQEVQRYTFRSPGQATAYFCGYTRLMELRAQVERALGARFDRQKYHDFLLAQGLLPPSLLRQAVFEEFVPKQKG